MNEITTSIKVDKEKWQKLKICLLEQNIKLKNWINFQIEWELKEWEKTKNESTTNTENKQF